MITIRVLDQNDYEQIIEINNIHSRIMGFKKPDEYNSTFSQVVSKYFKSSSQCLVGTFDNQQLLGFLGLIDWPHAPYWTFTSLKARQTQYTFAPEKAGLLDLVSYSVQLKARSNRHIYWAISSKKHYRMMTLLWRKSIRELNDFQYISRVIPAGYKPQDPDVWSLMGKRIWNIDLVLRVAVKSGYEPQLQSKFSALNVQSEDLKNEDTYRIIRL